MTPWHFRYPNLGDGTALLAFLFLWFFLLVQCGPSIVSHKLEREEQMACGKDIALRIVVMNGNDSLAYLFPRRLNC